MLKLPKKEGGFNKLKNKLLSNLSKCYTFIIYLFLYLPIFILVLFSFNESKLNAIWTGFSLKWYKNLIYNYSILEALKNSLIIAFVSSIIAVMIGTITAVAMYKYKFKGKNAMDAMLYVPIVIPEIVMGISLLAFFSELQTKLNFEMGLITLIIAHITFSIAYVIVVVRARLEGFDKALEEAAMDLGATPFQTFIKVTLPVIMPGIVAGALLAFTLSLDDVIISFFVAGPKSTTLPLKVFSMVKFGVTPEINALSTILMLFTLLIVIVAERLKSKNLKSKKMKAVLAVIILFMAIFTGGIWKAGDSAKVAQMELNLFNWSEFLPQSIINKFEETYNIKVNYSTFSSNEEMLAKLMAGGSNYDLVVASDYMVEIMKKQNLIQEIDKNEIPNMKNVGDQYKNLPFDEENKFSIPYMAGDTVIAVDTSKVKEEITSYKDLWKPEFKNSIVLIDDQREVIGTTLKMLGYSLNEKDENALQKAKEALKKLQSNVKAYDSESPKTLLINGEAKIGLLWGAEAALAKKENKNIKVIIPKEGLLLAQDNFVVPKDAKNKKAAELFMNFILEPEISAEISKYFPYANPNVEARKLIDSETLKDIGVYPPIDEVKKGEFLKDIGETITIYDKIWSEVKQ